MKNLILVTLLILTVSLLFSDTGIYGGDVSGTWTPEGSPYNVYLDISIPFDETLTIEPGVIVNISSGYGIEVYGSIIAQGTEIDEITFKNLENNNSWAGIKFSNATNNNFQSIFNYCVFRNSRSDNGGALKIFNYSNVEITNCEFNNNKSNQKGGAIYVNNSDITISNSIFENNSSYMHDSSYYTGRYYDAGAIFCNSSNLSLVRCDFIDNRARFGGALQCNYSTIIIENSVFDNNMGISNTWYDIDNDDIWIVEPSEGGAISAIHSSIDIDNSLFYDNSSASGDMGLFILSDIKIVNSNFVRNELNIISKSSNLDIVNSIFWNNSSHAIEFIDYEYNENSIANISNSCLENGISSIVTDSTTTLNWLEGNIDSNPVFTSSYNNEYSLLSSSPCINSGTPDTTGLNLPELDLAGNPRIYDDRIDMGCYEWQGVVSTSEDEVHGMTELSNYPNPFNPETTISFNLPVDQQAELTIYNLKGQKIRQYSDIINQNSVVWEGKNESGNSVSSGIYFYKLETGDTTLQKKMILLK